MDFWDPRKSSFYRYIRIAHNTLRIIKKLNRNEKRNKVPWLSPGWQELAYLLLSWEPQGPPPETRQSLRDGWCRSLLSPDREPKREGVRGQKNTAMNLLGVYGKALFKKIKNKNVMMSLLYQKWSITNNIKRNTWFLWHMVCEIMICEWRTEQGWEGEGMSGRTWEREEGTEQVKKQMFKAAGWKKDQVRASHNALLLYLSVKHFV